MKKKKMEEGGGEAEQGEEKVIWLLHCHSLNSAQLNFLGAL